VFGADVVGREAFAQWFDDVYRTLPTIRFAVSDVVVKGPPWSTTVAVRLRINATLADGSSYDNEAVQWIRLRWGKLLDDWVLEDTLALSRALAVQTAAHSTAR